MRISLTIILYKRENLFKFKFLKSPIKRIPSLLFYFKQQSTVWGNHISPPWPQSMLVLEVTCWNWQEEEEEFSRDLVIILGVITSQLQMLAVIVNKPSNITFKRNTVSGYAGKITNTCLRNTWKDDPVMQIGTVAGNTASRDKIIHRCCKCWISVSGGSGVLRTAMVANSQGSSRREEPVRDSGKAHYNVIVEKLI